MDTFRTRELLQLLDKSDQVVIRPLYLYDHSGLSISTSSFAGCAHHVGWDSGQIGFIWMDKETAMKNLANASDKIRLAQPITNDSHFHIPCGPDQDAEAAMAAKGYMPVRKEDILNPEANNLYGHWMENDVLFKRSNRLYVLEQGDHLESLEVRGPVATFNPKLEPLTDENWKARALQCLEGETVEYDNYLRGEIYFYEIYEGTDLMESSRGFNPGGEGIQDAVQDEFIDVVPGMSFEYSHDDSFDIESYFASHDFPALREKLTEDVKDFVIFESETSQVYPFALSAEEILANKDNILSHIVEELYSFHEAPDGTILHEVIESHAGKSRAVQPTLTVHDLDPNRDYTADELMGILKSKPSLADIILNAQARQTADEDNRNTQPQYHER